jgi:hypothetical protein
VYFFAYVYELCPYHIQISSRLFSRRRFSCQIFTCSKPFERILSSLGCGSCASSHVTHTIISIS